MGRTQVVATVRATVSSHNSEWDVIDRHLWLAYIECIQLMAGRSPFTTLSIEINASEA